MNIAMIGVRIDSVGRAVRIARAMSMIDAAASAERAPDLIAVHAGCDRYAGPAVQQPTAMAETFRAGICSKAREWGVYIAFGQDCANDHGARTAALLADADGDILAECSDKPRDATVVARETVFGTVGMCLESCLTSGSEAALDLAPPSRVMLVIGDDLTGDLGSQDTIVALRRIAARAGSIAFLVQSAPQQGGTDCFVCSQEGLVTTRGVHDHGCVAFATVPPAA